LFPSHLDLDDSFATILEEHESLCPTPKQDALRVPFFAFFYVIDFRKVAFAWMKKAA